MTKKSLTLEIVTPERMLLSEEIDTVVVPATFGYLGVLPNHAPLMAGLTSGVVRYRIGDASHRLAISGGFVEVIKNKVVILADTAERAEDIDMLRARQAYDQACRLLRRPGEDTDEIRAEAAMKRALARIKAKS